MVKIFLVLAVAVAMVSAGCADCERYLEQVKGISKTELMRLAMEYETEKDADVLFSLQGCLAVSPDFHTVCEKHVTNHGWADFDVLIQSNPQVLCQGIESCADSLLESSSSLRDASANFGARRRRQIKRASREAAKTHSNSRFVNDESEGDSEAEEKLRGVLNDDDRGALDEVMITASKGFAFNHAAAAQRAAEAAAAAARDAQARAANEAAARAAAERDAAATRAALAAQQANFQDQMRRALEAQKRIDDAKNRILRAEEERRQKQGNRLNNAPAQRNAAEIARLERQRAENEALRKRLLAMPGGGAAKVPKTPRVALKKKAPAKAAPAKAGAATGAKGAKGASKSTASASSASSSANNDAHIKAMEEMGNFMNAISAMNSPMLSVGKNEAFNEAMDEYDDTPVPDSKDGVEGCCLKKGAPSEQEVEQAASTGPEELAMLPLMMSGPGADDPATIPMIIGGGI